MIDLVKRFLGSGDFDGGAEGDENVVHGAERNGFECVEIDQDFFELVMGDASVQATAAGLAMALGGLIRVLVNAAAAAGPGPFGLPGAATGYMVVYGIEIALLLITIVATIPLIAGRSSPPALAPQPGPSA